MLFIKSGMSLPSPSNISYWWNFGSLLGMCLSVQLISGIFLAMQFTADSAYSFESVSRISQDVNFGWLLRTIHANGASMFFVSLYVHLSRGLYYSSSSMLLVWESGVVMLLLIMMTAFLGYVLPWGQMSFWGASVITSLIQAIPLMGSDLVIWLWGGFSVDNPTLTRFFTFHFFLPFLLLFVVVMHIFFLHFSGSSNPLGINSNLDKSEFHILFSYKDILGVYFLMMLFSYVSLEMPWDLGDSENFILANPLVTPVHIQPEWYFLFAYAILRSIPNKLGGVMALVFSVIIFFMIPFLENSIVLKSPFSVLSKSMFWTFMGTMIILTWIGARPVEAPYVVMGQVFTSLYFVSFFMIKPVFIFSETLMLNKN